MNGKRSPNFRLIRVRAKPGDRTRGLLVMGARTLPVSLGRSGIRANKREGDGSTPRGRFRLIRLWWRADRVRYPSTALPFRRIRPDDGWSENPQDRNYNRPVKVPASSGADRLWREDHLYDFIIELEHNTRPRVANLGSAVFIHFAREGFKPTAGCVGLRPSDLKRLLPHLSRHTLIDIR
jgi:L,D-peptidoglycan transpeptidase YkuD (ErfK/YbiS/YcfS/YnhG family)